MKNKIKAFAGLAALLLLAACDHAVGVHHPDAYRIEGDKSSAMYPLEVREHSEDVIVQMKPGAPVPKIVFIDPQGVESPYNFRMDGDEITIPDKFAHLSLRASGLPNVEILRNEQAK